MVILTIIVGTIYSAFSTTGRTVEQAEKLRDGTDLARTLISRIVNDVSNAYWNPAMAETFFAGRKAEDLEKNLRFDSLSLTTLTNWRKPESKEMDLWEVGFFFRDKADGSGRVLFRREKRELSADVPPMEGGVEFEVTDAVAGLRLRYSDGFAWQDEWDTKKQGKLPRFVEVLLTLADGRVYTTTTDIRNP